MRVVTVDAAEAAALRALARREPNPRTRVRLLGVANALSGMPLAAAAQAVGAGRATLYDWLGRYRRAGVGGLRDRPKSGRPRLLTPEQDAAFKARIAAGPKAEKDGVTVFRGVDMRRILEEEFKVKVGRSSVYQLARRLGLAWIAPRPQHPKSEAAARLIRLATSVLAYHDTPPGAPGLAERQARMARLIKLLQSGLDKEDAAEVERIIPDVLNETPRTEDAALKLKRILSKLGKTTYDIAVKVISDLASETAKKILGLSLREGWPFP